MNKNMVLTCFVISTLALFTFGVLAGQIRLVYSVSSTTAVELGSDSYGGSYDIMYANVMYGSVLTSYNDTSGTVANLTMRVYAPSTTHLKGILAYYSNMSIVPNGIGDPVTASGTMSAVSTFSTPPILAPSTKYVLAAISDTSNCWLYYENGFINQGGNDSSNSYLSPANPNMLFNSNKRYDIYCYYYVSQVQIDSGGPPQSGFSITTNHPSLTYAYSAVGQTFEINSTAYTLTAIEFGNNGKGASSGGWAIGGNPNGTCYAYLYEVTGSFGVNSTPIGSALAQSDPFNLTEKGLNGMGIYLTFSGVNRYHMTGNHHYALAIQAPAVGEGNVSVSDFIYIYDNTGGINYYNPGNQFVYKNSRWIRDVTDGDLCFHLFGTETHVSPPPPPPSNFVLTVAVKNQTQPISGVSVSINGSSLATTDASGTATISLSSGTYLVSIDYQSIAQNQTVALTANQQIQFDLYVSPSPPSPSFQLYAFAIVLVLIIATMFLLIRRRTRR